MYDRSYSQRGDDSIDVLLVEDNPGDIRLTEDAFAQADSETTLHSVTDGDAAIDYLKRRAAAESSSLPDLALVDLKLPGRDGCAVLEAIRADPELGPLPVLILTNSDDEADIQRCYEADANAYLTKPTTADEFASLVASVERFWFERVQLP